MSVLNMGAYTFYVWLAYGLFFGVVFLQVLQVKRQYRRIIHWLQRRDVLKRRSL